MTNWPAMPKAYWISAYRSINNPDAFAAYAKLAGPALEGAGGKFLARGLPTQVYENGLNQRLVLLQFSSVAQAVAAHDSADYQEALRALGSAADRDLRIVEGVEHGDLSVDSGDMAMQLAKLKAQVEILAAENASLKAPKTEGKQKPVVRSGCYQFVDDPIFYCIACYDGKGAKNATRRVHSRLRGCPACGAAISSV